MKLRLISTLSSFTRRFQAKPNGFRAWIITSRVPGGGASPARINPVWMPEPK